MAHISPQPLQAEDVQKLLGADETLVFWLVDEKETYVFALTRDGFEWRTIAMGAETLRLRYTRCRAMACHGVISAGMKVPESLVGPSWRLRRLQFPTIPATPPTLIPGCEETFEGSNLPKGETRSLAAVQ
jgi:hypothetical protein